MDVIKTGTILIENGTLLPRSLVLASEPYSRGWKTVTNLRSDFALRARGFDAEVKIIAGAAGAEIGLSVDESFYPLWELNDPENVGFLTNLDFQSIRLRRVPRWTIAEPDQRQRIARAEYQASHADAVDDLRRAAEVGEPYSPMIKCGPFM